MTCRVSCGRRPRAGRRSAPRSCDPPPGAWSSGCWPDTRTLSSPQERRPSRAWHIARSSTRPPPSARPEDRTMSIINYAKKEISFKIVYYGAGVVGKTVNLQYIHRALPDESRGNLISLATGDERNLFFDFL